MYLEHFGLGVNPFSLSPKLDFLYKSGTFEESMAHLVYGLDNHEAIVLITGPIGTGKTMALQSFLTNLGPRFEFALITNTRVTSIELLKLILEDLDVKWPLGVDKSDLLILFKEFLQAASREGKMVLIVVDEAQNLAPDVLEEIRLLTNLGQGEAQPVQIILVGQPELEETVNRPDLAQIRQRIRVHYSLDPLSRQETEEYINHRMGVAGCSRQVFTSGAIDRIFRGSHGVPRLVNTLAGEALLSAFVEEHKMVQPGDVEEDQSLSFATRPAPTPIAAPQNPVTPPPAVPTPPAPKPVAQVPAPHAPQSPPPAPTVPDRRRRRGGMGRIMAPWIVAALVVLALGALYNFGALDGLVEAIYPESSQEAELAKAGGAVATVNKPSTEPILVPEVDPETPVAKEIGDPEVQQAEVREAIPDEKPEEVAVAPPVQETIDPVDSPSVQVVAASGELAFFVHIFSFRTQERADSYLRRWDHPGHSLIARSKLVRGVEWHRIYLGPYDTRDAALLDALRLKQDRTIDYYKVIQLPGVQES